MKLYVVDNSKLRNAINKKARQLNTSFSNLIMSTGVMSNSVVRKAETRFDNYKGSLDFELDPFGLYAIYYEDIYKELCKILEIDESVLALQTIEKIESEKHTLEARVSVLETKLTMILEELQALKEKA